MEGKTITWQCGICGKEYSTIEERMRCEQNCKKEKDALHKQSEIEELKVEIENQKKVTKSLWEQYNNAADKHSRLKERLRALEHKTQLDIKTQPTIKGFVNGEEMSANEAVKVLRDIFGI